MGVINYALKGGALWSPTWNAQNNHFPRSTGAHGRQTLQGQSRAIRTAFQNFGGVEVSMVQVAAAAAPKGLPRGSMNKHRLLGLLVAGLLSIARPAAAQHRDLHQTQPLRYYQVSGG